MQSVITLIRSIREKRNMSLKRPIARAIIFTDSAEAAADLRTMQRQICFESNIKTLQLEREVRRDNAFGVTIVANADCRVLGKRVGRGTKAVLAALKALSQEQLIEFMATKRMRLADY